MIALLVANGDKATASDYISWAYGNPVRKDNPVEAATKSFLRQYLTTKAPSDRKIMKFITDFETGEFDNAVDFSKVGIKIRRMKYEDFLKTPYWVAIAEYIKSRDKKCRKCGATSRLEVHHTTYEHHGDELHHTEDLVCLCHDCHTKKHRK